MSRRNSLLVGLILVAVLLGLTACSPFSPVDRQSASPADRAIGRLTFGDAAVGPAADFGFDAVVTVQDVIG